MFPLNHFLRFTTWEFHMGYNVFWSNPYSATPNIYPSTLPLNFIYHVKIAHSLLSASSMSMVVELSREHGSAIRGHTSSKLTFLPAAALPETTAFKQKSTPGTGYVSLCYWSLGSHRLLLPPNQHGLLPLFFAELKVRFYYWRHCMLGYRTRRNQFGTVAASSVWRTDCVSAWERHFLTWKPVTAQ